jgi:F0F1-type ATP synthase beta subunit
MIKKFVEEIKSRNIYKNICENIIERGQKSKEKINDYYIDKFRLNIDEINNSRTLYYDNKIIFKSDSNKILFNNIEESKKIKKIFKLLPANLNSYDKKFIDTSCSEIISYLTSPEFQGDSFDKNDGTFKTLKREINGVSYLNEREYLDMGKFQSKIELKLNNNFIMKKHTSKYKEEILEFNHDLFKSAIELIELEKQKLKNKSKNKLRK